MGQSSYTAKLFVHKERWGRTSKSDIKSQSRETVTIHAATPTLLAHAIFNEIAEIFNNQFPHQQNKLTYSRKGHHNTLSVTLGIASNKIRTEVLCLIDARYMRWASHGLARAKQVEFLIN